MSLPSLGNPKGIIGTTRTQRKWKMTIPSVDSTLEVQFTDGTFVVPVWWAKALNKRTTTYVNGIRVVDCSIDEMRKFVNTDAVETIWTDAVRKQRSGR
jgi:phage-related protein